MFICTRIVLEVCSHPPETTEKSYKSEKQSMLKKNEEKISNAVCYSSLTHLLDLCINFHFLVRKNCTPKFLKSEFKHVKIVGWIYDTFFLKWLVSMYRYNFLKISTVSIYWANILIHFQLSLQ